MLFKRFNRSISKTSPGVASQNRPSIIFRLADFYLIYAEVANEVNPSDSRVLTYLNLVRERAGLPKVEILNPGIVGNKELQRAAIQRERQIELATDNTAETIAFYKSMGFRELSEIGCNGFMKINTSIPMLG